MKTKTCRICGESHDLSFYYKEKGRRDGCRNECKDCLNKKSRDNYLKNRDKRLQAQRDYYKSHRQERIKSMIAWSKRNPEKCRDYRKKYYEKNREKIIEYVTKWRERNPEAYKAINAKGDYRRRVLERNCKIFKVTEKDTKRLRQQPCAFCGERSDIQIDHIIPLSKGGVHGIGNFQPLCESCNKSKSDKYMIEWVAHSKKYRNETIEE